MLCRVGRHADRAFVFPTLAAHSEIYTPFYGSGSDCAHCEARTFTSFGRSIPQPLHAYRCDLGDQEQKRERTGERNRPKALANSKWIVEHEKSTSADGGDDGLQGDRRRDLGLPADCLAGHVPPFGPRPEPRSKQPQATPQAATPPATPPRLPTNASSQQPHRSSNPTSNPTEVAH